MRKDSGVVFGIAIGTLFYPLRLPESDRLSFAGAKRQVVERWADDRMLHGEQRDQYVSAQLRDCPIGPQWTEGKWLPEEIELCRRAYEWAG